jgi:hypothetical protein
MMHSPFTFIAPHGLTRITTPNNNVKMNKRKQKEAKINRTTMAETKEIEVTTTDEQEQSLLS